MKFTDKIAHYILEKELDLRHLTVVLPSERAKKYLSASLFTVFGKPIFAPKMVTIDQLVKGHSPYPVVDKTRLVILLFNLHQKMEEGKEAITFDEFLEWAPILLSDFDELDRYLLDVDAIFKDLRSIKDLEYWHLEEAELTPARKRFLEFWDQLPKLYHLLKNELKSIEKMNAGGAYKHLAQHTHLLFDIDKEAHYIFAGFNAMSTSELEVLKQTYKIGRGHILIDADTFYLKNNSHEAGMFLRQLLTYLDVKTLPFVEENLLKKELNIRVIECPQVTGQVKVASNELDAIPTDELSDTLVLLADENLILPLLKNIPKKVEKTNITLGMPLKSSAVKNWVDIIFQIQEHYVRFQTTAVYHIDVKRLLAHPFILSLASATDKDQIQRIEAEILQYNKLFVNAQKWNLTPELKRVLSVCFEPWEGNWNKGIHQIRDLNQLIYQSINKEAVFEKALIYHFDQAIVDFQTIIKEGFPEMRMRSFKSMFTQHWSSKSIAYHGNPIDGLQIMGLLETRLLDFKRIICLGLNEGSMPPTNPIQSMLPMDLRRYAGLPTPREKQGLFAHHFYRLLHNCEELVVTYSGAKDGLAGAEKSRYLMQLELELGRMNKQLNYSFEYYNVPIEGSIKTDQKSVEKDSAVIERLNTIFALSTTISRLNTYVNCPLDFYYKNVLDFGEENAVEEEMENSTFGTIVHSVLEDFYFPLAKYDRNKAFNPKFRSLTVADIELMELQVEAKVDEKFLFQFNNDKTAFEKGKNQLSFQMAVKMIHSFLKTEKQFIKEGNDLCIHSLEEKFEIPLVLKGETQNYTILLKGTIDRVEEVNGKIRVVDFKTGNTKPKDVQLKIGDQDVLSNLILSGKEGTKHALQLIAYAYMYHHKYQVWPNETGILSLMKAHRGLLLFSNNLFTLPELGEMFPVILTDLLNVIYDEGIPFQHKEAHFSFCTYC